MFSIRMTFTAQHPPETLWVLDGTKVTQYQTAEEAEKAMHRLRRNPRYSWNNVRLDVAEYGGKR